MEETFGQALRRLRGSRSLRAVAQLAYCSKSYVWDLETARKQPTREIAAALDSALNAGGELSAFTADSRDRDPKRRESWSSQSANNETQRYSITLPSHGVESLLEAATTGNPTPSTLLALRTSIEDYWRRDDQYGGETLRPAIAGHLRYVLGLLESARTDDIRSGLYAVAAELFRLTGWTHFDARQYSQAEVHFTHALQLAKEIDDAQFISNVLACMSLQATYQGLPSDALALAAAARDHARPLGTPRVMAMLSMREAFAHAAIGDRTATHGTISQAHRHFEKASDTDSDPAWVAYFNESKLVVDTGIAHSQLGESKSAERLISQGLNHENDNNHRGRAFHTFWLARTQLQRGELEQACRTATAALEPASVVASERVAGHLKEFRRQLAPFRHRAPVAVTFEARLREVLPARVSEWPHP